MLWAMPANAQTPFEEYDFCGTTEESIPDYEEPTTANMPLGCQTLIYVRVNVTFIQDGSGGDSFTPTGNGSATLPSDYTGNDFAEDLVNRMNEYLANNLPMNACNGWLYYMPEANALFGTAALTPPAGWMPPQAAPQVPFRLLLSSVNYVANQAYFDNATNTLLGTLGANNALNIANQIEIFVHPNGESGGVAFSTGYPRVLVKNARNLFGCNTYFSEITLHELGHAFGLRHTFYRYTCPSGDAAGNACPLFDDNQNICDIPYDLNVSGSYTDDWNANCESPISLQNQYSDALASTPVAAPCGAGLWLTQPAGVPYWRWQPCNEPEEIDNNTMNYLAGLPFAHAFTQEQIGIMMNRIASLYNPYIVTSNELFPVVLINELNPIQYFNCNASYGNAVANSMASICLSEGYAVLNAYNADWSGPAYTWSNGATTAQNIVSEPGVYSVTVTASGGCIGTASINVLPMPYVELPPAITICTGSLPQQLSVEHQAGNSYVWTINGVNQANNNPSIAISASGNYSVTVTNANNCTASATTNVTINPNPQVTFSQPLYMLCPETLPFDLQIQVTSGTAPYSFTWDTDTQTETVIAPGTYSLTVTDANGCTASATTTVVLFEPPTPQIIMTQNECTVTLTASGGNSYLWNNGSADEAIEVAAPNTYTVIATDANGCTAQAGYEVLSTDIAPTDFSGTYMVGDPANNIPGVQQDAAGNELWDGLNLRFAGTLVVPANRTLHIRNSDLQMVGQTTKIEVKQGAKLLINNNSVLRADGCQNNYWQGILIEGNTNKAHPTDYYANGSPHHGVAIVENSLIRDANTALHAYDLIDVSGSTMGGGIVYAKNSQFINNRVSIQLDRFRGEPGGPKYYQKSIIEDNTFYNDDASWFHIAQNPFTHIALNTAGPGLTIRQNNFTAQNALPLENRGAGIRTVNTHINIHNNEFHHILHGIDAYNLPSIHRGLIVKENSFFSAHRCLSMSGGVLATIAQNNFFDIQAGTQDLNGYGIFADAVWGYDISANTFTCTFGNNTNPYNLGIVARNGTNQASTILDNYFGGSFGIANLFAGQNSRLIVDCNIYDNNINNDWVINGFLNDQGECVPLYPLKARRNTFHTPIPGINGYNIDATDYLNPTDPTYLFQYVGQPGFNPTSVIGNIQVDNFCFLTPVSFENSQCSLDPDACGACDPDCWRALLDQTTEESKIVYLQTRLLRAQLCSGREEEAKQDLRTQNTTESAKLLTATYESEQKPDSAWLYLQQIPDDNAENIAFKDLYTQLLQGIQPPAGSGKTMSIQELYLRQTALQEHAPTAPIAQAINASYYGEVYYKNVSYLRNNSQQAANTGLNNLLIYPNPAANTATIQLQRPTEQVWQLHIYNLQGVLQKTYTCNGSVLVLPIDLPNGMYICKAITGTQVLSIQKLLIVK